MEVARIESPLQLHPIVGIPHVKQIEPRHIEFKKMISNVRLDNKTLIGTNFFKFADVFEVFRIPKVRSFMHAYCEQDSTKHVSAHIPSFSTQSIQNWPTYVYEDIYNIKIDKYFMDVPCCGASGVNANTFPIYKETTTLDKTDGVPCDIFYGVGMSKTNIVQSCINSILRIISAALRYSKDMIMISFFPFKHCSDIIALLAHFFDIKVYVTFFAQHFVVYFKNDKAQGEKLQATIVQLLKESQKKKKELVSIIATTPIQIEHLLSDIRYQVHMDRQQTNIDRCIRSMMKSHKMVQCDLLLRDFFKPILSKKYQLGPMTVIDGGSQFIQNYLQQYDNTEFVFVSIDLQKSIGRFYMIFMKYTFICIHHSNLNPKLFLKIYNTEIKYKILVENESYLFIKRLS